LQGRGTAEGGGEVFLFFKEDPSTSYAGPPPLETERRRAGH
jgi:hypothetical protein